MDYKTQYQMYLSQASAALEDACAKFLPEESEVCRAARYSLLGGGKRIRAVLVLSVCWAVIRRRPELSALRWKCCTAIR